MKIKRIVFNIPRSTSLSYTAIGGIRLYSGNTIIQSGSQISSGITSGETQNFLTSASAGYGGNSNYYMPFVFDTNKPQLTSNYQSNSYWLTDSSNQSFLITIEFKTPLDSLSKIEFVPRPDGSLNNRGIDKNFIIDIQNEDLKTIKQFSVSPISQINTVQTLDILLNVNKILLSSNSKTYSLTPPIYATETAIPQMTSNTLPSGRAFGSSEYNTSTLPYVAFDRVEGTGAFVTKDNLGGYLGYEFVNPIRVGKYAIRSTNNVNEFNRLPKDWTFEGSNDGISWTILDTQVNQIWTTATYNEYIIAISKAENYRIYRLNWSANGGNSSPTLVNELKMYELTSLPKLLSFPKQSEPTFINYGLETPINITQLNGVKNIESNSVTHESGKKFVHTIDLSKRRVDKIILS